MANIPPSNLVVKCIGHRKKNGKWFGICLNFDLAAQADSPEELQKKLRAMIEGYIETILETEDQASVSELLERRAPLKYWFYYYAMKAAVSIRDIKDNFVFYQHLPFCLSKNC